MYAQRNYPQVQGINGKYKIADIGCFMTSFCNLSERHGKGISPIDLNNYFVNTRTWIDIDDGIKDDLGWGSIVAYDGRVSVGRTVDTGIARNAGWPSSNDAIVRFYYKSVTTGQMIFHFCLVSDASSRTIIDSWDGVTKHSPYGEPTAWAEYNYTEPVSVAPPAQTHPCTYHSDGLTMKVTNQQPTNWYNLNGQTFQDVANNVAKTLDKGFQFPVGGYAVHKNGEVYGMTLDDYNRAINGDYSTNNGINIKDLDDYVAPIPVYTPPAPPVEVPKAEKYTLIVPVAAFETANGAWTHSGVAKTLDAGEYYVISKKDSLYNLSTNNMKDKNQWVNVNDNVAVAVEVSVKPPVVVPDKIVDTIKEAAQNIPVQLETKTEEKPVLQPVFDETWKTTKAFLNTDGSPEYFYSVNAVDVIVTDYSTKDGRDTLPAFTKHIPIIATYQKDGILWGLPRNSYNNGRLYLIPMRLLKLEKPGVIDKVEKVINDITTSDQFNAARYRLLKFVDGIKETLTGRTK